MRLDALAESARRRSRTGSGVVGSTKVSSSSAAIGSPANDVTRGAGGAGGLAVAQPAARAVAASETASKAVGRSRGMVELHARGGT
jgi:hypothetical protein